MTQPTKQTKKLIRQYGAIANERELSQVLRDLHSEFERWQKGEISPGDLNDKIHEFHDGPSKNIWVKYSTSNPQAGLAAAIASGLITKDEVPLQLLDFLARNIEYFESEQQMGE